MKTIVVFIALTIAIFFVNYYPHFYAYKHTPAGYVFSGQASYFDPWDITNYFSAIRQAQLHKSFLLENWNTTKGLPKTFIYPLYALAGILFSTVNPIFLYYTMAIIFSVLLCLTIFFISRWFLLDNRLSLISLFLISLGGGFGWLAGNPNQSADVSIPGVTLFSAFQKPHEALALILFSLSLILFFLCLQRKDARLGWLSILALVLLIPLYPYRLLIWFLVCAIFLLIWGGNWRIYLLGGLTAGLLGLAYIAHFLTSGFAVLTSFQSQPLPILSLIFGYGIFGILFILHLVLKLKYSHERLFLNLWVIVSILLAFWPGMGRLFLSGIMIPLVLIFLLSYKEMASRFRVPPLLLLIIVIVFAPLSSFYIFNKQISEAATLNIWYYLPNDVSSGFGSLRNLPKDGVLAMPSLNSYVTAQTTKKVYFGHKDQTPDISKRQEQAVLFYQNVFSNQEALAFLKQNNINYIIYTAQEKNLGQPYNFLSNIYKSADLEIWRY